VYELVLRLFDWVDIARVCCGQPCEAARIRGAGHGSQTRPKHARTRRRRGSQTSGACVGAGAGARRRTVHLSLCARAAIAHASAESSRVPAPLFNARWSGTKQFQTAAARQQHCLRSLGRMRGEGRDQKLKVSSFVTACSGSKLKPPLAAAAAAVTASSSSSR